MRLFSNAASLYLLAGLTVTVTFLHVSAHPGTNALKPKRISSILFKPNALPDLPTASQAAAASLPLDDIQGDILVGMTKQKELFFFFSITDAATFKLGSDIHPLITTASQFFDITRQPVTAVNIAFSQTGLTALGITDDLSDPLFSAAFLGQQIHGVFLLTSDTLPNVNAELANIQSILGGSIQEIHRLQAEIRPGSEQGHEHFGFMDGISQPAIDGFIANPSPGQAIIAAGVILVNETSDPVPLRPAWAKDGAFLAFRQLSQFVPEFTKFITDNPIMEDGLTPQQCSDLLGARMVGRWKSGAPVDLAPLFDDPVLAADPLRNNNFTFAFPDEDLTSDQTRCPFSAHVRKVAPRADFNPVNVANHIIRAGIPFGPEVTPEENASNQTTLDRGLAFVAYQSDLAKGFHFLQNAWANNPNFIFGKNDSTPGFDPVIGANTGQPRLISGLDPNNATRDFTLVTDFVESRGGEYFFCPSLSSILSTLAV